MDDANRAFFRSLIPYVTARRADAQTVMTDTHSTSDAPASPKRPRWRSYAEWGLLIAVVLFFRYTETGTRTQGWLQQMILATGLIQPDIQFAEESAQPANFDVYLVTLDGRPVSLESMRGTPIFMNIWATWCPPCLAEMPYIQELYDDMKDEGVSFVMISTDDTAEEAAQFIAERGYTFPVYRLAASLPEPYTSRVLPTTYVIGADGTLGTVHAGMANYSKPAFKDYLRSLRGSTQEL